MDACVTGHRSSVEVTWYKLCVQPWPEHLTHVQSLYLPFRVNTFSHFTDYKVEAQQERKTLSGPWVFLRLEPWFDPAWFGGGHFSDFRGWRASLGLGSPILCSLASSVKWAGWVLWSRLWDTCLLP